MSSPDQHTWIKDKDRKYKHICKVCGCIRESEFMNGRSYYFYTRSGIHFGLKRPVCIDWNDDTLD